MSRADLAHVLVLAPNFKRRLSGVTSTIIQLLPAQNRLGQKVAVIGAGLPDHLPHAAPRDLWRLWQEAPGGGPRIWHARRNIEMLPAILMRDLLRMRLKLVFTSASQRNHTLWTRFLISRMDAVIATSGKTAGYLRVPNTVIMHGIDAERFFPPKDRIEAKRALGLDPARYYAGCFGRIRHQKGTDLFVDAMIATLPGRPDWSAIVAGRATPEHRAFEATLKERVQHAGLEGRILFVGEHTGIDAWYRGLDLFVAPQRWEGFGLTPLEAMASGVPVIATDVGAFPELIAQSRGGEIVGRANLDAMAHAVGQWMGDAHKRRDAAQAARAHVAENFTIEDEARAIGALYDRLRCP